MFFLFVFTREAEAGRDKNHPCLFKVPSIVITKAQQKTDHYRMRIDVNFIPARRDIPPFWRDIPTLNWHRPWLPLKNPYERYIIFSILVLLCSFVHCIMILFNLGFSVFCTGQFVKQLFITELCNLYI